LHSRALGCWSERLRRSQKDRCGQGPGLESRRQLGICLPRRPSTNGCARGSAAGHPGWQPRVRSASIAMKARMATISRSRAMMTHLGVEGGLSVIVGFLGGSCRSRNRPRRRTRPRPREVCGAPWVALSELCQLATPEPWTASKAGYGTRRWRQGSNPRRNGPIRPFLAGWKTARE